MLIFKTEFCDSEEDKKTQIAPTLILQGTIFIITHSLLGFQSTTAQNHTKKGNKDFSMWIMFLFISVTFFYVDHFVVKLLKFTILGTY